MPDSFQTVTLVLLDGRRLTYTGRAQIDPDISVGVVDVLVSQPHPLPEGTVWDTIKMQTEKSDE